MTRPDPVKQLAIEWKKPDLPDPPMADVDAVDADGLPETCSPSSTAVPSTNCATASPSEITSPGRMRIVALASRRRLSK
jgi:hypothetical protein